jgi:hypothetical protein
VPGPDPDPLQPGVRDPGGQPVPRPRDEHRNAWRERDEQRADGAGAALQRLEPLADVADQHLGEERELGLVEVESCLPLVDRREELGDLGGERPVRIEHSPYGVRECGRFGALGVECQQGLHGRGEGVEPAEGDVPDVVDLVEHALDELVNLLPDPGDEVAVAPPVVVGNRADLPDRGRHL